MNIVPALLLALLITSSKVHAAEAAPAAADPQLEARFLEVANELRCLVCQNQTLADSSAPLAIDLREQLREKMKQRMSNEQIVDYIVSRYGDFVRYRPPLKSATLLLWFGPVVLLLAALAVLIQRLRRQAPNGPNALTEAERARARALLAEREEPR